MGDIEYVRECPTCRAENAPDVMRCACGALLAGVDMHRKGMRDPVPAGAVPAGAAPAGATPSPAETATATAPTWATHAPASAAASTLASTTTASHAPSALPASPPPGPASAQAPAPAAPASDGARAASPAQPVTCPHADCGQPNPPGSTHCVYCDRPLADDPAAAPGMGVVSPGLLSLPAALKDRYRIVSMLPAKGAEAELLIVEPAGGGPRRVAKIYRHGIVPKRAVQERIVRIDARVHVQMLETGVSEGYAYEVMEYCERGSLRERMAAGPLPGQTLQAIVRELAAAIAAVHAEGLVHRDLKPGNVLVRSDDPLELVLTDFSIASVIDGTQRFTSVARTLPYASPESLSGVIDGKSDYWALGMIVLEAALGRHPFAGLSDAVILHHLTTRSVDLSGIAERNLRKLLRGLLLRDPGTRWGNAQITRWLAGDPGLSEPLDQVPGAGFGEPYRIADEVCETPEQLAVALAKHWQDGIADLGNGQLLAWFRGVQKDHNVVRLMIEMNFEKKLHVDVQLLRLILHLAPGIPPVWRGESVALPAILGYASQALNGDADAAQKLAAIYQFRVLETYAQAGNEQAADIVQRWSAACDRFDATWKRCLALIRKQSPSRAPDEAIDWHAMQFGMNDPARPTLPSLHPRLLAITYDAAWGERLRKRLLAELTGLQVHCPWLGDLGDPLAMDGIGLLTLEAMLPEARAAVARQNKADARRQEELQKDCQRKVAEVAVALAGLRAAANHWLPTVEVCTDLRQQIDHYAELLATVRALGRSDDAWVDMRRTLLRGEPVAKRMGALVDDLEARLAENSGWLDLRVLGFLLLGVFVVPTLIGQRYLSFLALVVVGVIVWRLVPNFFLMREISELGRRL